MALSSDREIQNLVDRLQDASSRCYDGRRSLVVVHWPTALREIGQRLSEGGVARTLMDDCGTGIKVSGQSD